MGCFFGATCVCVFRVFRGLTMVVGAAPTVGNMVRAALLGSWSLTTSVAAVEKRRTTEQPPPGGAGLLGRPCAGGYAV